MEKISTYTSAKDQMLSAVVPKQTRTYKPVSNAQLIDLTLESIDKAGFTLAQNGTGGLAYVTVTDIKPTNVQVGSRYEETDTRKVYNYKESDTIEEILQRISDETGIPMADANVN